MSLNKILDMKPDYSAASRHPKLTKAIYERYSTAQPLNGTFHSITKKSTPKVSHINKTIRIDAENFIENDFGASPQKLDMYRPSPRAHPMVRQASELGIFTARESVERNYNNIFSVNSKQSYTPKNMVLLDRANYMDKSALKDESMTVLTPKLNISELPKKDKLKLVEDTHVKVNENLKLGEKSTISVSQSTANISQIVEKKDLAKSATKVNSKGRKPLLLKVIDPKVAKEAPFWSKGELNDSVGLSCRNLNIEKSKTDAIKEKELDQSSVLYKKKEFRTNIDSSLKQASGDMPTNIEDSPPLKSRPVNTLKSFNASLKEFSAPKSLEKLKKAEKPYQAGKTKEAIKLAEEFNQKMNNVSVSQIFELPSRRESYPLNLSIPSQNLDLMGQSTQMISSRHTLEEKEFSQPFEYKEISPKNNRKGLEDLQIFEDVLEFLCINSLCQMTRLSKKLRSSEYFSLVKKAKCRLIIRGLSPEDQYSFWNFHVNFDFLQRAYPLQYMMNSMKPSSFERDILSDLDRTRNFNEVLIQRQNSLLKVLLAFSNSLPKTGYIQGLNSIAAVLLSQKITEPEAYWLMKYIFQKKKLDEVFSDCFTKVQLLTYQLEIYIRNYLPEIIDYLGENGMNVSYFATQWFITMFSYDLELSHLLKVWNLFFVKGWKVVIRIALSILWHFKGELCTKTADELPTFLKTFVTERITEIPELDLFNVALSFKVSNRLLKCLETLYDHSAPINVILISSSENKLQWKILPDTCSSIDVSSMVQKDVMEYLNENIAQIQSLNRIKGNVCHQLDNYRSVHLDLADTSLALDTVSIDHKSSARSLHFNQRNPPPSADEPGFMQTLSSLGRKLKQILTPKNEVSNIYESNSTLKIADFTVDKEALEAYNITNEPSTRQSNPNLHKKRCNLIVSSNNSEAVPYKKTIIGALRESNEKLGINLFDPMNFTAQRERNSSRRCLHESKINAASTSNLLEHRDEDFLGSDKPNKHKRTSTLGQKFTLKTITKSQSSYLDIKVLDGKISPKGDLFKIKPSEYIPNFSTKDFKASLLNDEKKQMLNNKSIFLTTELSKPTPKSTKAKGSLTSHHSGMIHG